MKDTIIIYHNPYSMTSPVFIFKNGMIHKSFIDSNVSTLAEEIAAFANKENIFTIKIDAPDYLIKEINQKLENIKVEAI